LIADIDHFKRINDTYGHDVGDVVLKEFAVRLLHNVRTSDLTCRLGGEEFMILMPDTNADVAAPVAERVRACIAEAPFIVSGLEPIPVTASVGLGSLRSPNETPETLFKRADEALYAAKRGGRNRVIFDEEIALSA